MRRDGISEDEQGIFAAIGFSSFVERKASFGDNINRVRDFCGRINYPITEEYSFVGYKGMAYLKAVFTFSDVARVEFCSDLIDLDALLQCCENESITKTDDETYYFEISMPDKEYCFDARALPDELSELMTMELAWALFSPYYIPGLPDNRAMDINVVVYDYLSKIPSDDDDGIIISIPLDSDIWHTCPPAAIDIAGTWVLYEGGNVAPEVLHFRIDGSGVSYALQNDCEEVWLKGQSLRLDMPGLTHERIKLVLGRLGGVALLQLQSFSATCAVKTRTFQRP